MEETDSFNNEANTLKKLWWLHDSYWHATAVKELGPEKANELNLQAAERFFRSYTLMLLKEKRIQRPKSIEDLVEIFRYVWKTCFFDELYIHDPITIEGNEATWIGKSCNAFNSLSSAKMTEGYSCGCQSIRNGVMKALKLKPLHTIDQSLINGDSCCVIRFSFEPR